jgi:hypothetical protein
MVCLLVAAGVGLGLIVLQRWVAETRWAAILLVGAWLALSGVLIAIWAWRHPGLRLASLGTWAAIVLVSSVAGYWTGFRDRVVDEPIVMAVGPATAAERSAALSGDGEIDHVAPDRGPIELAAGMVSGADGHSAMGTATLVRAFEVDPGAQVEVYLTRDADDVEDRVELGELKGTKGNQQYENPPGADLAAYDTLILYCTPFTVRMAVAPLRA